MGNVRSNIRNSLHRAANNTHSAKYFIADLFLTTFRKPLKLPLARSKTKRELDEKVVQAEMAQSNLKKQRDRLARTTRKLDKLGN